MVKDSNDYPHIKDKPKCTAPDEALLIEYQEVGEEWRNYEKLLNQSYYLSAIMFTFFAGTSAKLYSDREYLLLISLGVPAIVTFVILGFAGKAYYERRQSASRLRTQIAEDMHELTNSQVPRIQKVVVGGGSVETDEREDDSNPSFWGKWPIWKLTLITAVLTSITWLAFTLYRASLWFSPLL